MSNYPLLPLTMDETDELEAVREERRLALQVASATRQLRGVPTGPTAVPNAPGSPRSKDGSPRMTSPATEGTAGLPKDAAEAVDEEAPDKGGGVAGSGFSDLRLLGSRSHEFVDVASCLLYPQLEVTTRSQARQQVILLQVITSHRK